mgnify:CR=1 FL=1
MSDKLTLEYEISSKDLAGILNNLPQNELRELAIATFYNKGYLSIEEASSLLGKDKREFLQILVQFRIPFGGEYELAESEYEEQLLNQ